MRAYVYVDGFNLFYRALDGTAFRWLNLAALAQRLLQPADTVDLVRYFTARVSARAGHPNAPRKQQIYFSALGTLPNLKVHYGRFLTKEKSRPLVSNPNSFVRVHDTEEKGSDVNLAVHLVNDAWKNLFDVALVLSQDTDLIEPLEIVKTELNKNVGLVWLDGKRPAWRMAAASSFVRHISQADLAAAQFPAMIQRVNAHPISKPHNW